MLAFLDDPTPTGVDEAIHEVRRRGKQVRALLRLVRPAIRGDFKTIDRTYRGAGRLLAPARDARIVVETFDDLFPADDSSVSSEAHQTLRSSLEARAVKESSIVFEGDSGPASDAMQLLRSGREQASGLRIPEQASSIVDGATRTYAQGRDAFNRIAGDPSPAVFHTWRIRVKQRRHQIAYLADFAPSDLSDSHEHLYELSDLLGAAHDLVVLRDHLQEAATEVPIEEMRRTLAITDQRRTHLESRAFEMGAALFNATPGQMHTSLVTIWETWDRMRR
jgi:CHAD domain-containing protein